MSLIDTLIAFFEQDDWQYEQGVAGGLLTAFKGENGQWTCQVGVLEDRQQVVFLSICPLEAPPDHRHAVSEFIQRANYGLFVGHFEMDFDSGRVQCRTGIDVEGSALTIPLVRNLVYLNVVLMDKYLPGLTLMINGQGSPAAAIRAIEG